MIAPEGTSLSISCQNSGVLLAFAIAGLLSGTPRVVTLPAGSITVYREMRVPAGFTLRGHPRGTVIRCSSSFAGRAVLIAESNVTLEGFSIDGNRTALEVPVETAPYDRSFASFYDRNGIVAENVAGLRIRNLRMQNIANFAVIVTASRDVAIERLEVSDSGSRKLNGRNNTSGGLLIEEGSKDFSVRKCRFLRIRGNGLWTHSRYTSPRNGPGIFAENWFEEIGRDALQAGHATDLLIRENNGRRIGWPVAIVDVEGGGTPVAIDTAGNVSARYERNRFEEINGKCIDLDGFHDGLVTENVCINSGKAEDYPFGHYGIVFNNTNPDMQSANIAVTRNVIDGTKFGAIFVIGERNVVTGNRLTRINLAGCNANAAKFGCLYDVNQPDLLRAGIYLGSGAERPSPARFNIIDDNVIEGYGMAEYCVAAAPGIELKGQVGKNTCRNPQKQ